MLRLHKIFMMIIVGCFLLAEDKSATNEIIPNVRFLGEDYKDKDYTGKDLDIPVHWISRDHGWSTTKLKDLITRQTIKQNPDVCKGVKK